VRGSQRARQALGFNVNVFASSEDFLQSNRIMDTSCLITDVQMPGLSAVQLQGLLLAEGHRTPIIFITLPLRRESERATKRLPLS
jgi:FixJ family two-component response regulator